MFLSFIFSLFFVSLSVSKLLSSTVCDTAFQYDSLLVLCFYPLVQHFDIQK